MSENVAHLSIDNRGAVEPLKAKIAERLREVCAAMDEANAAGFEVAFQIGKDFTGRNTIAALKFIKEF